MRGSSADLAYQRFSIRLGRFSWLCHSVFIVTVLHYCEEFIIGFRSFGCWSAWVSSSTGGCCWPAGDLSPALYRPCRSLQMFFSASSGASSSVSGLYSSGRNLVVGQCVIVSHRHFLCRRPAGTLSSGRQGFDFGQKPDAIFLEYVIFCVGRLTRVLFFSFLLLGVNNTFITNNNGGR